MKTKFIVIGVVAVTLLLVVIFGFKSSPLGGLVHNTIESFTPGLIVGGVEKAACIKVRDTDEGGWSYITYLNGVETVTGGSAATLDLNWTIPTDCLDAATIYGS
jgi:hypothetical protein